MNNYIYHHGILGQKWGVRRYQNADGTLTAEGRRRKLKTQMSSQKEYDKTVKQNYSEIYNRAVDYTNKNIEKFNDEWSKEFEGYSNWSKSPKYQEYVDACSDLFNQYFELSVTDLFGDRPEY